ncbi:NUDIX hydrolase domain-containing protein [Cynara cardunculus var. scolymus]|uniref:NUDIX hydrolase domain-containing protein n=1 Tax=Cynara cardunculus var. scolymus TaxID=59895 RepID=A0A124SE77_CYNCS|nr:NUDIX hydrolase domain-containing protein [Cynara cardunculus var. scolymus]
MEQVTIGNCDERVQLLPAICDEYGGVVVELKEHMESDVFLTLLKTSMSQWTLQGKKGVWIKLPIHLANLVETTVKEGFWYHHAEPDYLMLVNWIPKTTSTLPLNASHRVGVGAIVLNDKQEIRSTEVAYDHHMETYQTVIFHSTPVLMLVVQEKSGILRGTGIWKIPTGIVEVVWLLEVVHYFANIPFSKTLIEFNLQGEDISAGVIREVVEETGIDTEFVEVLAFRQSHKAFFGKSDLFFVCMMRPLSFDIQIQELEIEAAQWMPLEEVAAQPFAQKTDSLMNRIMKLCKAKVEKDYSGFTPHPVTSYFSESPSYIYFNNTDFN